MNDQSMKFYVTSFKHKFRALKIKLSTLYAAVFLILHGISVKVLNFKFGGESCGSDGRGE